MDANGTRFHLLLGEADWAAPRVEIREGSAGWDGERAAFTLTRKTSQAAAPASEAPLAVDARRGAARDRYGNWYFISETEDAVLVTSSGSGVTTALWTAQATPAAAPPSGAFGPADPPAAPPPARLRGLAVTCHHYLVVGVVSPPGLLIFDLFAPAPPRRIDWPADQVVLDAPAPGAPRFAPFDMAATPEGGVLILDRENRCFWALDARFQAIARPEPPAAAPPPFQPAPEAAGAPGADAGLIPPPLSLRPLGVIPPDGARPADPIAIEALPDGTALVLDRPIGASFARFLRFRGGDLLESLSAEAILDRIDPDHRNGFTLLGHDLAFVPAARDDEQRHGRIYVASERGLQSYAFDLLRRGEGGKGAALAALAGYYPMRRFGGRGLVTAGGRPHYDSGATWVPLMEQPRPRYEQSAIVEIRELDGREPGCIWHRLLLDGCIPRGARLDVWTRAADDRDELARATWQPEPSPALRRDGPEIPFLPRPARDAGAPADEEGTWDLLFQRARGRYIEIRLGLQGDGTTTPRIHALRAYYPRFSYLERYLPAAYREDPASASFVDRLLSLFEGFYTPIEDRIAAAHLLLDVRSAPPEALEWLAGFFDVVLDPAWDDARRRLFLRNADRFFRLRGTIRGVTAALELAIAQCPDERLLGERGPLRPAGVRIIERFLTRQVPGVVAGDPVDLEGIREVPVRGRWLPEHGGAALSRAYRDALLSAGVESPPAAYPIRAPKDGTADLWRTFSKQALGFTPLPADTAADLKRWQAFLARRHGAVGALNAAYGGSYPGFTSVPLPAALPPDGAPLADWLRFQGQLAVRAAAHHFVVALPVPPGQTGNAAAHQERRRIAERVVALEKPAHTTFEVRFYWAMFRIGEARLGLDTQVHWGSRAPELYGPFILDESYVGQGYHAPRPPDDAVDRWIAGRDRLDR